MTVVAHDHRFTRDTYALSTAFMDLFFNKRLSIDKDQLQVIGFAAVCLAGKIEENKSIANLGGGLFGKAEILNYEFEIMKTLEYKLNPDTYIYWGKLLMSSWDSYN